MKFLRPAWRLIYFLVYTSRIVIEIWLRNVLTGKDLRRSMRIRRKWAVTLLRSVGVRLRREGHTPSSPCILVSNHRSYLDPILMLCDVDAFPVAKAELASWPIIGRGALMAGILYLKRDNIRSRAGTLHSIHQIIESGFPVIIFPEGTTSSLPGTLPFKRGVFQLAAKHRIPVVPVALAYRSRADYWVGKESFLSHAGRRFREKKIDVIVHYGHPLPPGDSGELAESARSWIENNLRLSPYPVDTHET